MEREVKLGWVDVTIVLISLIFPFINGFHFGAPCWTQFTMSPSAIFHGVPQNTQTRPPPYQFDILDMNDVPVRTYKEGYYKVKLTGWVPFRGFLIQARAATKEGYPIGHLRVGKFVQDSTWNNQSVQIQPCPLISNDSITHTDPGDKNLLQILWKIDKNHGPILFMITIVQHRSIFWTEWLPSTGFLLPDESGSNKTKQQAQTLIINKSDQEMASQPMLTPSQQSTPNLVSTSSTGQPGTTNSTVERTLEPETPQFSQGSSVELESTQGSSMGIEETSSFSLVNEATENSTISISSLPIGRTTMKPSTRAVKNNTDIDFCSNFPCYNNGTCKNMASEDRYECSCTGRWIGKHCEIENFCMDHICEHDSECINGNEGYHCKCKEEWAGEFCERSCPSYLCENNGTCILTDGGKGYGCACAPGWTGEHCQQEIDQCQSQPCQHGGTCIRQFNGFQCKCANGYMGTICHRPCQDIYGSCQGWSEEQKCERMRSHTKFFDTNCAITCKQCIFDNQTVITDIPLPPVLEPFDFLLGRWISKTTTHHRFSIDFGSNATAGYQEEIVFSVLPVPMFGTPSIYYSAVARRTDDPSDVHVNVGFITLKPLTRPLKVSLMSTGNDGITVIEEGTLNVTELTLVTQYLAILPKVDKLAPAMVKRTFSITDNEHLQESVERLGNDGEKDVFTKFYFKHEKFLAF